MTKKNLIIVIILLSVIDLVAAGWYMSRRIEAGGFSVDGALKLSEIRALADAGELEKRLLPVDRLFADRPDCRVKPEEERKLRCGNVFPTSLPDGEYRVYGENGAFLMLGRSVRGSMHTLKSFFEV